MLNLADLDAPSAAPPTMTWGISMVDVDRDGDLDIVQSDDQVIPSRVAGGVNRGGVHVLLNDGQGRFSGDRLRPRPGDPEVPAPRSAGNGEGGRARRLACRPPVK